MRCWRQNENFFRNQRNLSQYKPIVQEKYKVKEMGVFGSYVSEQNEASDVDVLIDFEQAPSSNLLN